MHAINPHRDASGIPEPAPLLPIPAALAPLLPMHDLTQALTRFTDAQAGPILHRTAIDGLLLLRATEPDRHPTHLLHGPTLCLVVQGAKETTFGDTPHTYRAGQALVVTVDVPGSSRITAASPERPYLSAVVGLDPAAVAEVVGALEAPPTASEGPGTFVLDVDPALADCVLRAVRLLDTPAAIPVLYPAIHREICYRLLTGPRGGEVARLALSRDRAPSVARALHELRARFDEPILVEELAGIAHLSPSAFHRRFKALTSMTPIQYQKRLRLLEARRIMLDEAATAESAALAVGYESPSQFSREYTRAFGAPPQRDIGALRASVV